MALDKHKILCYPAKDNGMKEGETMAWILSGGVDGFLPPFFAPPRTAKETKGGISGKNKNGTRVFRFSSLLILPHLFYGQGGRRGEERSVSYV
jgi:hypothetical protein